MVYDTPAMSQSSDSQLHVNPQTKKLFVVIRRRDSEILAYCLEVEDAARVVVRQSRKEECCIREADVDIGRIEILEARNKRSETKVVCGQVE